jgi:putative ABC transport system permease protein
MRLAATGVSAAFFETLGVQPLHGRFLRAEDDRRNAPRVIVLSHRLWLNRFGADASAIGTTLQTDDGIVTVVGVAPPDFDFPRGTDVWLPVAPVLAAVTGLDGFRQIGILFVIGRLHDGVSAAAAEIELSRVALDSATQGAIRFGTSVRVTPFLDHLFGPVRMALWWLVTAAGLLLLIACNNVWALSLTRAVRKRRERAIRCALGASNTALWRPWVIEAALMSIAAAALGLIVARWLVDVIVALAPDDVPRLADVSINLMVVLFTFAASFVAALLGAAAPLFESRESDLPNQFSDMARATEGGRSLRARSLLLKCQITLTVVLLAAAGLIFRSYVNFRQLDLGFDPAGVVTIEIDPRQDNPAANEWIRDLVERVAALPGVEAAGAVYLRPLVLGAIGADSLVRLEGQPDTPESLRMNPGLNYQSATPGYFAAMGVRLKQGRLFGPDDHAHSPRVVLVGETAARRLWPDQNPIGRRLVLPSFGTPESAGAWRTVIGVVSDVRYRGLDDVRLDVYEPALQSTALARYVIVRSETSPFAVAAAVQSEARRLNPRVLIGNVMTMEAVVGRALAAWRLSVWLFASFGLTALVLAGVGLFSVVALDTAQRSREFAVRMALGAMSKDVMRRVVKSGMREASIGTCAGLLIAAAGTQWMRSLLFRTTPLDPATYLGVVAAVFFAVALACALPAYRASRIDPAALLKRE